MTMQMLTLHQLFQKGTLNMHRNAIAYSYYEMISVYAHVYAYHYVCENKDCRER